MDTKLLEKYAEGFATVCVRHGVDTEKLYKRAQLGVLGEKLGPRLNNLPGAPFPPKQVQPKVIPNDPANNPNSDENFWKRPSWATGGPNKIPYWLQNKK